jgi:hypothetical protein
VTGAYSQNISLLAYSQNISLLAYSQNISLLAYSQNISLLAYSQNISLLAQKSYKENVSKYFDLQNEPLSITLPTQPKRQTVFTSRAASCPSVRVRM